MLKISHHYLFTVKPVAINIPIFLATNKHTLTLFAKAPSLLCQRQRENSPFSALFLWLVGLIVLGFYDTLTFVGHFVSSPREKGKIDRRDSRDEREGQGKKRNRNERDETEEIKTFPSTRTCYKDSKPYPTVSQYQLDPHPPPSVVSRTSAGVTFFQRLL